MAADKLYFFWRSANKYPGLGSNESVSDPSKYLELSKIPDWRQKLSNFWVAPFEVNGLVYNSMEHLYQGNKIATANQELSFQFTLNSGSELSRSSGEVAQKNRKIAILTPSQLKEWEAHQDKVIFWGLYHKFRQNPDLKSVLFLTDNAELWHGAPRVPMKRQFLLEGVRSMLAQEEGRVL